MAGLGTNSPFAALQRVRPFSEALLPCRRRVWLTYYADTDPDRVSRMIRLVPPH